jgi:hypothetical protein
VKMFDPVDILLLKKPPGVTLAKINLGVDFDKTRDLLIFRFFYTHSIAMFKQLIAMEGEEEQEASDMNKRVQHIVRTAEAAKDAATVLEKLRGVQDFIKDVPRLGLTDKLLEIEKHCSAKIVDQFQATLAAWKEELVLVKMPDWYTTSDVFLPDVVAKGGIVALKSISQMCEPTSFDTVRRMAAQLGKHNDLLCVEFAGKINTLMLIGATCALGASDLKTLDPSADVDPAMVKDVPADTKILAHFMHFTTIKKEMSEFYKTSQEAFKTLLVAEEGVPTFTSYS